MAIKLLNENTINKIAAGEVIENPANVVKELVENSIDSNAKNIFIDINNNAFDIKITDDGKGFYKEDIKIAFLQHATSKLNDIEDLNTIHTFGFRGEALASIATVSKVTLITKNSDENVGYKYCISFGNKREIEEYPSNIGTIISVNELFANTPVRKKFLKGPLKEIANIVDLVEKFALSNTDISFTLNVDNKQKFKSMGDSKLSNVLYSIYGKDVYDNLVEINDECNGIKVFGLIAKPMVARNTRNDEIYFINNRIVKDSVVSKAVEAAYDGYLMQHKYPLVTLNIIIDSKDVDVNVHPRKSEVRFKSDEGVYFAIYNLISNKLKSINLIHAETLLDNEENDVIDEYVDNNEKKEQIDDINRQTNVTELESLADISRHEIKSGINLGNLLNKLSSPIKNYEEKPFIEPVLSEDHKYIGQVFDTYVLIEFQNKLYIIDQHAAHEKINFERIMKNYKEGKVSSQKVFPSILLKLTPFEMQAVCKNIDEFTKIGFELESFGDNEIKIDAVPYNIYNISSKELLMDMISSFADDKNKENYDSIVEKIASISCKSAIKANHKLSEIEVKSLLRELFKLDNPYNCPHGRPTIISLSKNEFEKKFGRIV